MATKILKNYKRTGEYLEEFPYVKIKDEEDIFIDRPICVCDYDKIYKKPIVINSPKLGEFPICYDEEELKELLKDTSRHFFKIIDKDGNLEKVKQGKHDVEGRFKNSIDIKSVIFVDGLFVAKDSLKKEQVELENKEGNNK